jgi:hypothetical protein
MTAATIRAVSLPNGGTVPAPGAGTGYMGERPARRATGWPPCVRASRAA